MKNFLERLLSDLAAPILVILFFAGVVFERVYADKRDYSSEVQLPESPKAQLLVEKCLATEGYKDPKFKSSWRLNNVGNMTFFRCDIEEKIDHRERSRLDICSTNPVRRYSWEEHYIR